MAASELNSEMILTDEQLDEFFVKEVCSLVKLATKLPNQNLILPICTRWFNIFQKADPKHKFVRNCLLLQLHKQLNDNMVSFPFTGQLSYLRDMGFFNMTQLNSSQMSAELDDQTDSLEWLTDSNTNSSQVDYGVCYYVPLKDANKDLVAENSALADELRLLQYQHEELLQRRKNCQKICNTMRDKCDMYDKEITSLKEIFSCSARAAQKPLSTHPAHKVKFEYFAHLFTALCVDTDIAEQVQTLDTQFEKLVNAHIDTYSKKQREPVLEKASQDYYELRKRISNRFKNAISTTQAAQEKEIALTSMRYLIVLRKVFLNSFKGSKRDKRLVLKFLSTCYNELAAK